MKRCTKCQELLSLAHYYRGATYRDGYNTACKRCVAKWHAAYQHTKIGRAALARAKKRWQKKNARRIYENEKNNRPEAHEAGKKLRKAVATGKLIRPRTCGSCGATGVRIEAHHDDYSKPLDVRWLCHACHREIHGTLSAYRSQ